MKAKSHWKQIPVRFLKCQQASRINLNAELHRLWDGVVVMRLGEEFRRVAGKEARELSGLGSQLCNGLICYPSQEETVRMNVKGRGALRQ